MVKIWGAWFDFIDGIGVSGVNTRKLLSHWIRVTNSFSLGLLIDIKIMQF